MQITLNQREIEAALRQYIANKLPGSPMNFPIEFVNSRAPNGLSATVDLDAVVEAQTVPASKPVVQGQTVATAQASPLTTAFQQPVANTPVAAAEPETLVLTEPETLVEEQPVPAANTPAPNKLFG